MKTIVLALLGLLAATQTALAAPPDYRLWKDLLSKYYDPAKGMDYKSLKANDKQTLDELRRQMAQVDITTLSRQDQLAYWINLYNISTVNVVVERYPIGSIRDLSTDPLVHMNVFKKDHVLTRKGAISLNDVEDDKIRESFKDPRVHFAIHRAAKGCPPLRPEPYSGAEISNQLDDQVRKFLLDPKGLRLEKSGATMILHVSKILDWFAEDFNRWGGGQVPFLDRYVTPDKRKEIEASGNQIKLAFDDYDWKLNDASQ